MLLLGVSIVLLTANVAFGCSTGDRQQIVQQATSPCGSGVPLTVRYYGSPVACGTTLQPSTTSSHPSVQYANVDLSRTYTLLMVTSDNAGSDLNSLTFFLHWAITGIEGFQIQSGQLPWSPVGYIPPFPNNPPTYHYKFILLEEPVGSNVSIAPGINRFGFDLGSFMSTNNMCTAVAMSEIGVTTH